MKKYFCTIFALPTVLYAMERESVEHFQGPLLQASTTIFKNVQQFKWESGIDELEVIPTSADLSVSFLEIPPEISKNYSIILQKGVFTINYVFPPAPPPLQNSPSIILQQEDATEAPFFFTISPSHLKFATDVRNKLNTPQPTRITKKKDGSLSFGFASASSDDIKFNNKAAPEEKSPPGKIIIFLPSSVTTCLFSLTSVPVNIQGTLINDKVIIAGKGTASFTANKIKSKETEITLQGGGNCTISQLQTAALTASLKSTGTLDIKNGEVQKGTVLSMGGGDISFSCMTIDFLTAELRSTGNLKAHATSIDTLRAAVKGNGELLVTKGKVKNMLLKG